MIRDKQLKVRYIKHLRDNVCGRLYKKNGSIYLKWDDFDEAEKFDDYDFNDFMTLFNEGAPCPVISSRLKGVGMIPLTKAEYLVLSVLDS